MKIICTSKEFGKMIIRCYQSQNCDSCIMCDVCDDDIRNIIRNSDDVVDNLLKFCQIDDKDVITIENLISMRYGTLKEIHDTKHSEDPNINAIHTKE